MCAGILMAYEARAAKPMVFLLYPSMASKMARKGAREIRCRRTLNRLSSMAHRGKGGESMLAAKKHDSTLWAYVGR